MIFEREQVGWISCGLSGASIGVLPVTTVTFKRLAERTKQRALELGFCPPIHYAANTLVGLDSEIACSRFAESFDEPDYYEEDEEEGICPQCSGTGEGWDGLDLCKLCDGDGHLY